MSNNYNDLREFLDLAEKAGELLRMKGVNWDLEMGALAEIIHHKRAEVPEILFEDIPGYPGMRVLSGATNSSKRLAMCFGFPEPKHPLDVVKAYRNRMKTFAPIAPVDVETGPVFEVIEREDEVNILKFPVPKLHELDGGRYIGTHDQVIMRDPDEGWVNLGTYRVMVHDEKHVGMWMSPGKQGRQIMQKHLNKGESTPVLICCGMDPLMFLASGNELKWGLSEYDYAGGHKGSPFQTVKSELFGLPMPAHAEIVLEGEIIPNTNKTEGPFGEFTGYYASEASEQPVIRVRRVYHRRDPILMMASPMRPPSDFNFSKCVTKSGMIWDEVERAGLSGVQGVWVHEAGSARMFNVISIKQAYPGHAKQAGLLAAGCQSGSYLGRYVVVVDHDVDPSDMFDVMWAISTRADPANDIDIIRRAWSGPLDPIVDRESSTSSRAIIDATRPFERIRPGAKDKFPPVARCSPELIAAMEAKFADVLAKI